MWAMLSPQRRGRRVAGAVEHAGGGTRGAAASGMQEIAEASHSDGGYQLSVTSGQPGQKLKAES